MLVDTRKAREVTGPDGYRAFVRLRSQCGFSSGKLEAIRIILMVLSRQKQRVTGDIEVQTNLNEHSFKAKGALSKAAT